MSKSAESIRITIAGRDVTIDKPDSVVFVNLCKYCGKRFESEYQSAEFCKPSHRKNWGKKTRT